MLCSTCMLFCLADHVLRQEEVSPPLLAFVIWIFLSPSPALFVPLAPQQHWLPHSQSQAGTGAEQAHTECTYSPCFSGARPHPSPTVAFSSLLLSASPNLKHNYPASPVPNSVWRLWPIICTAPKETGKNHLRKQTDFACCHQKGYFL